ncbi:hypothetical protein [Aquimarina sp. 2201CG14-23]|uniref:hypothetical protein n=1 Tax=Aquimarina mycalae TaxID=3040073 RepID=UPI0024781B12|nr:hypothetical protein [Aquimarina sp. 2201CG14-23]MDH7447242.1 hypothetical protein [Aquimarina sp. 2201CG14-23]
MEDIYKKIVKEDKLNKNFKLLTESSLFDPAKNIIKNICLLMNDQDGNFVKDFQSTGFDSRLWEIYLFIFLFENQFQFLEDQNRPDFHVKKKEYDFFIEASLSAEKIDEKYSEEFIKESIKKMDLDVQKDILDYYTIRLGSVLFSKLNKKYWELDWVKDKPLVFAITPSHNYLAKFLPDAKLMEYLYGRKVITKQTEKGLENLKTEIVKEHTNDDKKIPSHFFSQPDTENVSAIIFSNNCDLHKFNRMGYEHKLSEKELMIFRIGSKFDDSKPNAPAKDFTYQVEKGKSIEDWNESLTIYHNPNAKFPLDRNVFHNVRQIWINEDGKFDGIMMKNYVFHSITTSIEIV